MDFQGRFFDSFQELRTEVESWCRANYHPICVGVSHLENERITLECPHSLKRRGHPAPARLDAYGQDTVWRRPMQSVNYTACTFRINLGRFKDSGRYKVGKCVLEHCGHPIGPEHYATYSIKKHLDPERALIEQLVQSNAPSRSIAETLKTKTGVDVRRKDIENFKRNISPVVDIARNYGRFCDSVQNAQFGDHTGIVQHLTDHTGQVTAAFFCTAKMRFHLIRSQPKLVQMDSTFGIDKNRYKVSAVVYHNPGTNLTEIGAIFFVNKETKENYRFVLRYFSQVFTPEYFLVDKDLSAIEVLNEIFPRATIFLCIWHVMCYLKRLINTSVRFGENQRPARPGDLDDDNNNDDIDIDAEDRWDDDEDDINFDRPLNMPARSPGKKVLTTEEKKDIFDSFVKLVYASDQDNFDEKKEVFLQKIAGVWVKANTRRLADYTQLVQQYFDNWDRCQVMWAVFHRSAHPVADLTTNRIERSWWSLKAYLKMLFASKPSIEVSIEAVVKMWDTRFSKVHKIKNKTLRHADPMVSSVFESASFHLTDAGLNLLLVQLEACFRDREANAMLGVTTQHCPCQYYRLWQFPCCHILWCRHVSGVSVVQLDNISRKYWKNNFLLPAEEVVLEEANEPRVVDADNGEMEVEPAVDMVIDDHQLEEIPIDRFAEGDSIDRIRAGWREMFGRLERDLEDRGVPHNNRVWSVMSPLVDSLMLGHCPSEEAMREIFVLWARPPQPRIRSPPPSPRRQSPPPSPVHPPPSPPPPLPASPQRYQFYEQNPQRGRPRGRQNQRQPAERGRGRGRPANDNVPPRIRGVRRQYARG